MNFCVANTQSSRCSTEDQYASENDLKCWRAHGG
jgi:hypothetical protein